VISLAVVALVEIALPVEASWIVAEEAQVSAVQAAVVVALRKLWCRLGPEA